MYAAVSGCVHLIVGSLQKPLQRAGKRVLHALLGIYKSFSATRHFMYYRLANALSMALVRAGPQVSP
jgi:hypothetical protein